MPWTWLRSPGGAALPAALDDLDDVLVLAHEWLDVVPCTVAEVVAPGRLAVVLVDPGTGAEATGGPPTPDELAWCARHWPLDDLPVGARVEVGTARDRAWADLVWRVRRGTLLAVDYGHTRGTRPATARSRPTAGAPSWCRCPTGRATSPRTSPSTPSSTTR